MKNKPILNLPAHNCRNCKHNGHWATEQPCKKCLAAVEANPRDKYFYWEPKRKRKSL